MSTVTLTYNQKELILRELNSVVDLHSDVVVNSVDDPIQSHCVRLGRSLTTEEYKKMKSALRPLGLSHFRKVTNSYKNVIICFNAKGMK